jgi:hypothetical protein
MSLLKLPCLKQQQRRRRWRRRRRQQQQQQQQSTPRKHYNTRAKRQSENFLLFSPFFGYFITGYWYYFRALFGGPRFGLHPPRPSLPQRHHAQCN